MHATETSLGKVPADWERIGLFPHHGINTPLFSLRTEKSSGIGEFLDLIPLIDWLSSIGFDILQLLPLYDSGFDPSPYNALSAHALHPIYISLNALPGMDASSLAVLNLEKKVHYAEVLERKTALLLDYFESHLPTGHEGFQDEQPWLLEYARYKEQRGPGSASFYIWLQWIAFSQMAQVKAHAEKRGVLLKGDLPILVSPQSVDVEQHPELFDLSLAAGAPPDQYNEEGQRWGFPLYRFEEMKKNHFSYWKGRLKAAEPLYHLYRLDHIVGFFRLYAIPEGKKPIEGHYVPVNRDEWRARGKDTLEALLRLSPLLPIGEDLGIIPHEAREVMQELAIPGTKVVRWERRWKGDMTYIPYSEYPLLSMTTVSTHDSNSLETWWRHHPKEASELAEFYGWPYREILPREQLIKLLYDSHHTPSFLHINLLHEYLSLFPDLSHAEEFRINTPGTVSPDNWCARYPASIEEIVQHKGLSEMMQELIR